MMSNTYLIGFGESQTEIIRFSVEDAPHPEWHCPTSRTCMYCDAKLYSSDDLKKIEKMQDYEAVTPNEWFKTVKPFVKGEPAPSATHFLGIVYGFEPYLKNSEVFLIERYNPHDKPYKTAVWFERYPTVGEIKGLLRMFRYFHFGVPSNFRLHGN